LVLGDASGSLFDVLARCTYSPFCGGNAGLGGTVLPILIGTQKNAKVRIATQNEEWQVMPVGALVIVKQPSTCCVQIFLPALVFGVHLSIL
jgi:hypothetical protein